MKNSKRILILNTGGTISSVKTTRGLEPTKSYIEAAFSTFTALKHPDLPEYIIHECCPLIDSANMTSDYWNKIVKEIEKNNEDMDGFIIFHGTDTMANTASALSFMLLNLAKPIIITGSQLPLSDVRSDALENTITSLMLCCQTGIHEVCIYFNHHLYRGNRTRKLHSQRFAAFDSPNYPPLATAGTEIELHSHRLLPKPERSLEVQYMSPQSIATFRLFPGYCIHTLKAILHSPIRALILETYGMGNAPNDAALLLLLESARARDILIVNATQCTTGYVDMSRYATGQALQNIGVIGAADMTIEAIHSKLLYGCSRTNSIKALKKIMETNLCGEMGAPKPLAESTFC